MSHSLSHADGVGWSILFPCRVVWIIKEIQGSQAEAKSIRYYCLKAAKNWKWVISSGIRSELLGLSRSPGSVPAAFTPWLPCQLRLSVEPLFPGALLEVLIAMDGNRDVPVILQRSGPTFLSGLWLKDICTNILWQSPSSKEGLLNRSHWISQGSWILQSVRKQTLRPLMWASIVSMECESFPVCEGELGCIYCTNTHKHHVEIINVFMMEICASFIICRILSGFETIVKSISFSLSLLTYSQYWLHLLRQL